MDNCQLTRVERIGILLAVLLSASAGAVDIIGYLQFDRVFVGIATLFHKPGDRNERLKLRTVGSIWTAYAAGAAGGALAVLHFGGHSLLLPAGVLCLGALLIFATHFRTA
jgi:uncharacterized membrane protein YoaK (UPF0700 family)